MIKLDTSVVDEIKLYTKVEEGVEIKFKKKDGGWSVAHEGIEAAVEKSKVKNLLTELISIKPNRLAANKKEKWGDFQVTDSANARVLVMSNGKDLLDLTIGKFSYQQPSQTDPYGRRNRVQGTSYFRLTKEEKVYATDGFLPFTFNQEFKNWRDMSFISLKKKDIRKLTFTYPADSGFVAQMIDSAWAIGGIIPDSASMAQFINKITHKTLNNYVDDFNDQAPPNYELQIEGVNMETLIIKAWKREDDFILQSSINKNSYFSVKSDGYVKDLFVSRGSLLQP